MVQDLGLKYASTIRAMAHWDSKKISLDGLNGDGMTSALFIYTFLNGVAKATDWNWASHLTCITALSPTV